MAQIGTYPDGAIGASSGETETVLVKSEANLAECRCAERLKTGRNTAKFTNSGLRIIKFCPDFAKFPEVRREIAAILGILTDKPLVANGLPRHFVLASFIGQGIIRDLASRFGTVPRFKCRSEKPSTVLASSGGRTAVSVRFRTFSFSREHRFTKAVTRSTV